MTADSKINIFNEMVTPVVSKKLNISHREFVESEGEVVLNWLNENSIPFDQIKLKSLYSENGNNYNAPQWLDYRGAISEQDKIKFDNFFRQRTVEYIFKYPTEFFYRIIKKSFHITLLNPLHIWSDHNFRSGEIYYFSDKHDELVKYRIFYSSIIYFICLLGLIHMIKKKEYRLLLFLSLSIIYFYGLVSWNGNTRYFLPAFIYASFFFGYGADTIISFIKKKNEIE